ncbi:MAG: YccF domain-containing protein [Actinomycetota bacterium]|nr:YccF domain-containing protein [Actinomycetota bacterium]
MGLLLNLIWLVFGGLLLATSYFVVALVMCLLVITIPFGVAAARIGLFCLWPFGRVVVRRANAGTGSAIGNLIWFVLAGWWLALGHLVTGLLMCVTIVGIPLGLANFKLIPVSLTPFGREIVGIDQTGRPGATGYLTVPSR